MDKLYQSLSISSNIETAVSGKTVNTKNLNVISNQVNIVSSFQIGQY